MFEDFDHRGSALRLRQVSVDLDDLGDIALIIRRSLVRIQEGHWSYTAATVAEAEPAPP
jgi:hypothetical protein